MDYKIDKVRVSAELWFEECSALDHSPDVVALRPLSSNSLPMNVVCKYHKLKIKKAKFGRIVNLLVWD